MEEGGQHCEGIPLPTAQSKEALGWGLGPEQPHVQCCSHLWYTEGEG